MEERVEIRQNDGFMTYFGSRPNRTWMDLAGGEEIVFKRR
jgi:hypothetical protein